MEYILIDNILNIFKATEKFQLSESLYYCLSELPDTNNSLTKLFPSNCIVIKTKLNKKYVCVLFYLIYFILKKNNLGIRSRLTLFNFLEDYYFSKLDELLDENKITTEEYNNYADDFENNEIVLKEYSDTILWINYLIFTFDTTNLFIDNVIPQIDYIHETTVLFRQFIINLSEINKNLTINRVPVQIYNQILKVYENKIVYELEKVENEEINIVDIYN